MNPVAIVILSVFGALCLLVLGLSLFEWAEDRRIAKWGAGVALANCISEADIWYAHEVVQWVLSHSVWCGRYSVDGTIPPSLTKKEQTRMSEMVVAAAAFDAWKDSSPIMDEIERRFDINRAITYLRAPDCGGHLTC